MAPLAQMAGRKVNVAYAEATGSFLVLLGVAQQQGFFQKLGVDVQPVATRGGTKSRSCQQAVPFKSFAPWKREASIARWFLLPKAAS